MESQPLTGIHNTWVKRQGTPIRTESHEVPYAELLILSLVQSTQGDHEHKK
jgi:hypothetical protein